MEILAELTVRLAVPVPKDVHPTCDSARHMAETFSERWESTGRPIPEDDAERVIAHAHGIAQEPVGNHAANGDLHFEQVLAGGREPWLIVDPILLRGDREYDLGRVLWSRFDEITNEQHVVKLFELFVRTADVPRERARSWVVTRAGSYLTYGLSHGLTWDPPKCARLIEIFA